MKTAKKGICLALALVLCLGLFAACGRNGDENGHSNGYEDRDAGGDGNGEAAALSDGTLAGIDAKAVVLEIEGARPVLWEEFFYDLQNYRLMMERQGGPIWDWDEVHEEQTLFDEEMTFNELALRFAIEAALERRVAEILFIDELGERLEPDFYEQFRAAYMMAQGLDEYMFYEALEHQFLTEDMFRYVHETVTMLDRALELFSDIEEAWFSDEAVAAIADAAGIFRARHILISVPEEEQGEGTARAYALFEELDALSGEEQIARFDEMLAMYGEDQGMLLYPEGYTFTPGVMVPEFTEGTMVLEPYEIGPPVRSEFGYHIILRLPVERFAVPMFPGGEQEQSMQEMVAILEMEQRMERIQNGLRYMTTPLFDTIVPSEIFFLTDHTMFG